MAELAEQQWGVVSLGQLRSCGLSRTTVGAWAADGRLHRMERGVYAVGHRTRTARGWWMVSALACGDDALIGFRSALAVYGVLGPVSTVDVITSGYRGLELDTVRARRCAVEPDERATFHGIPVTTLARTFIDAATQLTDERLAMALNEAVHLELYDHAEMTAALRRHRGRRGVAAVRAALADVGDEALRFRSRAEARARALILDADSPRPR